MIGQNLTYQVGVLRYPPTVSTSSVVPTVSTMPTASNVSTIAVAVTVPIVALVIIGVLVIVGVLVFRHRKKHNKGYVWQGKMLQIKRFCFCNVGFDSAENEPQPECIAWFPGSSSPTFQPHAVYYLTEKLHGGEVWE